MLGLIPFRFKNHVMVWKCAGAPTHSIQKTNHALLLKSSLTYDYSHHWLWPLWPCASLNWWQDYKSLCKHVFTPNKANSTTYSESSKFFTLILMWLFLKMHACIEHVLPPQVNESLTRSFIFGLYSLSKTCSSYYLLFLDTSVYSTNNNTTICK